MSFAHIALATFWLLWCMTKGYTRAGSPILRNSELCIHLLMQKLITALGWVEMAYNLMQIAGDYHLSVAREVIRKYLVILGITVTGELKKYFAICFLPSFNQYHQNYSETGSVMGWMWSIH